MASQEAPRPLRKADRSAFLFSFAGELSFWNRGDPACLIPAGALPEGFPFGTAAIFPPSGRQARKGKHRRGDFLPEGRLRPPDNAFGALPSRDGPAGGFRLKW
ncbi:MAG: hypothetical protein C6W57_08115 [Caldibacillus debilis]|nr:hypothetical protein [Bacillaceae bacterium]REJ16457.1 MAG: hypothetical protein C6W57_08115 [Caldibacillus debilis]